MKSPFCLLLIFVSFCIGCSDVSPDAVELKVDFSWEGVVPCAFGGNSEIKISGIPDGTKTIVASMHETGVLHGKQTFTYDGSGIIRQGALDRIEGPCPRAFDPGRYKYKIEAVNENGVIIGIGSKERYYPEKK
jgi:hypothetical protein